MSYIMDLDESDSSFSFEDLRLRGQKRDGTSNAGASNSSLQSQESSKTSKTSSGSNNHLDRTKRAPSILKRKDTTKIIANLMSKKAAVRAGVRFSEIVDTKDISILHQSALNDLFYESADFHEMRYEAFMEECGLDPNEFD